MVPRRRWLARVGLVLLAAAAALGVAELVTRAVAPVAQPLQMRFADGSIATPEVALQRRLIYLLDASVSPRPHYAVTPGVRYFMCYEGYRRPWLDERGCVEVRINSVGVRERASIGAGKPADQRRVVCLGDSITFGYMLPVDVTWPRLVEQRLRADDDGVRLANCGFMGTFVVDEYWWALRHRFHVLEPDVVLVTLCLNDLIPSSHGMVHQGDPPVRTGSALIDRVVAAFGRGPFRFDPAVDHVEQLLALPAEHDWYAEYPRDQLWAGGKPQRALREMQAWSEGRGIELAVAIWPFLQNLEADGDPYPFVGLHRRVGRLCAELRIPFLDLLPVFRGHASEELWVAPFDMHPNPRAQRIAAPAIAAFLAPLLRR